MTPERWQVIDRLYHDALERDAKERDAFLNQACGRDADLRHEVESLIASHQDADNFIAEPALKVAARQLAEDQTASLVGRRFSHYQIDSLLGTGGMGEVYLAEDLQLPRKVALKLLCADFTGNKDRLLRFEREAFAASSLNHPNILTIYEIGAESEHHFIVTEFIEGESLRQYTEHTRLELREILDIGIQVASALAAAHAAGIVHRDIKPENIMVRHDRIVKIVDFGVAKLIEQEPLAVDMNAPTKALHKTAAGIVIGTVNYVSPEQARAKDVDARSDVWSLGVVLYEMLAGRAPFAGDTVSDALSAILRDEPSPLAFYAPELTPEIQRIVTKSLRKNSEERYQTVMDLGLDLKSLRQRLEFEAELERTGTAEGLHTKKATIQNASQKAIAANGGDRKDSQSSQRSATSIDGQVPTDANVITIGRALSVKTVLEGTFAAIALIVLVAALALSYRYFFSRPSIHSIAVMPFANESADPNVEYLSDGVTGNLIESLTKVPDLQVKALSTVRYKGANFDARSIGQALNVDAVLFGRLIETGEDLTLQVELVDSRNENIIWRRTYQKKVSGLVVLQSELARDLVGKLSVPITDKTREKLAKRDTENSDANLLYHSGVFHARKLTEQDIKKAIELFSQAILKDPEYARAYAALASAHRSLTMCCDGQPSELLQAKLAAQKAVELDPELAEGHSALAASIYSYDWNWAEAEKEFLRALELDPNSSMSHFSYADFLGRMARRQESNIEGERARKLEPYSPFFNAFGANKDPEKAVERIRFAIELDPNFYFSHSMAAVIYGARKMYDEAIKEARLAKALSPDQTWSDVNLSSIFVDAGRPEEARAILDQLLLRSKSRFVPPYHIALVYNNVGDKERALYWLEKAYDIRDPRMPFLKTMNWKNVENDPRFQDILRRVGLAGAK